MGGWSTFIEVGGSFSILMEDQSIGPLLLALKACEMGSGDGDTPASRESKFLLDAVTAEEALISPDGSRSGYESGC